MESGGAGAVWRRGQGARRWGAAADMAGFAVGGAGPGVYVCVHVGRARVRVCVYARAGVWKVRRRRHMPLLCALCPGRSGLLRLARPTVGGRRGPCA